jgi:hypothetical protein
MNPRKANRGSVWTFVKLRLDRDYLNRFHLMGVDTPTRFASVQSDFQKFAIRYLSGGWDAWCVIKAAYAEQRAEQHTNHPPTLLDSPAFAIKQQNDNDVTIYDDYDVLYADSMAHGELKRDCIVQELFSRFVCFKACVDFVDVKWGMHDVEFVISFGSRDMADCIPKLLCNLEKEIGFQTSLVDDATFVQCDDDFKLTALSFTERSGCDKRDMRHALIQHVGNRSVYKWLASLPPTFNAPHLVKEWGLA